MSFRRMLPFIFLNIIVSAAVVLAILWWWDGRTADIEASSNLALEFAATPVGVAEGEESFAESPAATEETPQEDVLPQASGPEVHIVAAGETLGQISVRYNVSVEEIMEANGMNNPNFLSVGQELTIPGEDGSAPTAEATAEVAEESSPPTPIPTEPAAEGESDVVITEVTGVGELAEEAVQIVNNGSSSASLSDWKLSDQFGNFYTFGPITLFGDGAGILVHTAAGQNTATDLYWGEEETRWNSGDLILLYDADGTVRAELQVP